MKYLLLICLSIGSFSIYGQIITNPKYPGVYVEELPTPSNSVMSLPTSTAAFIGNTEKNLSKSTSPVLVTSFAEYVKYFGGAASPQFKLVNSEDPANMALKLLPNTKYFMYSSMELFFKNGGGTCYVVSSGNYTDGVEKKALLDGVEQLEKVSDVNQVVVPDAMLLPQNERAAVQQKMLLHAKANNRFAILDVFEEMDHTTSIDHFRTDIQNDGLKYGAAYYPWLKMGISEDLHPKDYIVGWEDLAIEAESELFKSIKKVLAKELGAMPPSGAIAGIYAKVDNRDGVWKAPANVAIDGITGLTSSISDAQQRTMNVSLTDGKSVNALRTFQGRGNVIWGARTLAGNDNEYRYISVRRLTSSIEQSIEQYMQTLVFEPNDHNTWVMAKNNIENYLNTLWRAGGISGATSEQGFSVKVGLGTTMTQQDLDDGKIKVEVHVAAIRPAEFLVLKFETEVAN